MEPFGKNSNGRNRNARRALLLFIIIAVMIVTAVIIGLPFYGNANNVTPPSVASSTAAEASTTPITAASPTISAVPPPATTTVAVSTQLTPPAPIVTPSSSYSNQFGMSVGESMLGLDSADLNAELNNMASLGIGWLRFDIQWDYVQPYNSSTYNWNGIDQLVAAANAHHIKLLPILDYTPRWARSTNCTVQNDKCLPANPTQFAAFAKAAVARYAPEGVYDWEIWNEPNTPGSVPPSGNASAYATLLRLTYTAIKNQNRAAVVIVGGLSPASTGNGSISPIDFLSQLYADGDKNYFDAIAMHPYSFPAMPGFYASWNAWSQMASTTPSLRSVMIANGDASKQIWMTEYGAPTGGPGIVEASTQDTIFAGDPDYVTEAVQAAMISQAITLVKSYTWAGPLFIYSYKDLGTSTSTVENFFGIIRNNGTTKPAYQSIKTLLSS